MRFAVCQNGYGSLFILPIPWLALRLFLLGCPLDKTGVPYMLPMVPALLTVLFFGFRNSFAIHALPRTRYFGHGSFEVALYHKLIVIGPSEWWLVNLCKCFLICIEFRSSSPRRCNPSAFRAAARCRLVRLLAVLLMVAKIRTSTVEGNHNQKCGS